MVSQVSIFLHSMDEKKKQITTRTISFSRRTTEECSLSLFFDSCTTWNPQQIIKIKRPAILFCLFYKKKESCEKKFIAVNNLSVGIHDYLFAYLSMHFDLLFKSQYQLSHKVIVINKGSCIVLLSL